MIGRISGRLDHFGEDHVMIDVGGVGYVVHVSERTRASLPPLGDAASLWTELLVREDLMQLMGFLSVAEREGFRLLTSVQGVGAKAAMAILGTLGADGAARAIALGDAAAIKAAPGVGPKLAQRIALELKDKAARMMTFGAGPGAPARPAPSSPAPAGPSTPALPVEAEAEALSALTHLGYAPSEAAAAVAAAATEGQGADTATLIRAALKKLAPAV